MPLVMACSNLPQLSAVISQHLDGLHLFGQEVGLDPVAYLQISMALSHLVERKESLVDSAASLVLKPY